MSEADREVLAEAAQRIDSLLKGQLPEKISTVSEAGDPSEGAAAIIERLNLLIDYHGEISEFIVPLAQGELKRKVPKTKNFLASPFKELH